MTLGANKDEGGVGKLMEPLAFTDIDSALGLDRPGNDMVFNFGSQFMNEDEELEAAIRASL